MRLCTYSRDGARGVGFLLPDGNVADLASAAGLFGIDVPALADVLELVQAGAAVWDQARAVDAAARAAEDRAGWAWSPDEIVLHHPYRPESNVVRAGGNCTLVAGRPKPQPLPTRMRYHTKAPTAVLDPGAPVRWPWSLTDRVYAEPQLAMIVGETLHYDDAATARRKLFGYAVATDVISFDLRVKHSQWVKGGSLDTFFPWGPFVVTADEVPDPDALTVRLVLNGEKVLEASTSDTVLGVGDMLAEISTGMRFVPGDVFLLGTPEIVGFGREPERWLRAGDTVTSEIDGIGSISNPVQPEGAS